MTATTTAPNIDTASSIHQLRDDGYCILHGIIPTDIARTTRIDLWRVGATCGVIAQSYNPNLPTIPFYTRFSVIKDVQRFAPYLVDPRVTSIVHPALGAKVCVTATTALFQEPGTARGDWHAGEPFDSASTSLLRSDQITHLTLVWMFSPFTPENGGTLFLPGSHRRDRPAASNTQPDPEEFTATGTHGSLLITDSRLWRAVAANDDELMRLSVVTGFAAVPETGEPPRDEKSVLSQAAFDRLPAETKPLFKHWVK